MIRMPDISATDRGIHKRRSTRRIGAVAFAVVATIMVAGCMPNPTVASFEVPGATWAAPRSLNVAGQAVGAYLAPDGGHAFVADIRSGVAAPLPDPPASPAYPDGVQARHAIDINDAGLVLAIVTVGAGPGTAWELWTYDTFDGAWTTTDCPVTGLGNRGLLANGGLLVCGDRILDTATGVDIEVPSPEGCDGAPARVNAHRIVVGWCASGDEPFFATDLDTAATVGFGADLDPGDEVDANTFGSFTDSGYQVVMNVDAPTPHSWVYRIPTNLAESAPTRVELGAFAEAPMVAMAISEGGMLAANVRVGDAWVLGVIDVERRSLRAWDTDGFSGGPSHEATFVVGVNDAGEAIGFRTDPAAGVPYSAFAVAGDG